jgi:hypothetical protein
MVNDIELEAMFSIVKSLKSSYVRDESIDPWANSPFAWIKTRLSRQVGKGEQIIAEWCKQKRFLVLKSGDSECDLVLNGHRVEIKFSTLWESGVYTFQQLRDQNYEYAFLLGISPFAAHGWFVPLTQVVKSKNSDRPLVLWPRYRVRVDQLSHPVVKLEQHFRFAGRDQHGTVIGVVAKLALQQDGYKVVESGAARAIGEVGDTVHQQTFVEMVVTRQQYVGAPGSERPPHKHGGAVRPGRVRRVVHINDIPGRSGGSQPLPEPGSLHRACINAIRLVVVAVEGKEVEWTPDEVIVALLAG